MKACREPEGGEINTCQIIVDVSMMSRSYDTINRVGAPPRTDALGLIANSEKKNAFQCHSNKLRVSRVHLFDDKVEEEETKEKRKKRRKKKKHCLSIRNVHVWH